MVSRPFLALLDTITMYRSWHKCKRLLAFVLTAGCCFCQSRMRWTVHGIPRVPWDAEGIFDGISTFRLDRKGKIYEHQVRWGPVHAHQPCLDVCRPANVAYALHCSAM